MENYSHVFHRTAVSFLAISSAAVFLSSCSFDKPYEEAASKKPSEESVKKSVSGGATFAKAYTTSQCQDPVGINSIRRDLLNKKLSMVGNTCVNAEPLQFLGEAAAVFRIVDGEDSSSCQVLLDFDTLSFVDDTLVSPSEDKQIPANLGEEPAAAYLFRLRADVDLTGFPYSLSLIDNDELEAVYSHDVNAHAIEFNFVETSIFEGGRVPLAFSRTLQFENFKKAIEAGRFLPRLVPGQPADDPLKHFYNRAYDPDYSSGMAYDFENRRHVRMFGAPELASPFSLVGVQRRDWQGNHDFYVKAKQVFPSGKTFVEHGVARDQLFRMTEIFDVTQSVLTNAINNCDVTQK